MDELPDTESPDHSPADLANHATTRDLISLGVRNIGSHLAQTGDPAGIEAAIESLRKLVALRDSLPKVEG